MPREHLTTGYFGKLPAAGDFVAWNLPKIFTDRWDRWMSMELQARPDEGELDPVAWRFSVRGGIFGEMPASGVWRMSQDRAGRRFPFVIAGLGTPPDPADPWFDAVAKVVDGVVGQALAHGWAAQQIAALPQPGTSTADAQRIAFWLDDWEVMEVSFADIYDLADNALPVMRAARAGTELLP